MKKLPILTSRYWLALILMSAPFFPGILASGEEIETSLADAAERQRFSQLGELLKLGVEVNAAQVDGMTALHWSVYHEDAPAARRLIDAGADVNAVNRYGVTPLSLACLNGNTELVERLLEAGADSQQSLPGGEKPLMTAARTGRVAPVRLLLARGAEVNATERSGQTALMWGAAEGHLEVVEALLAAGADFRTPLATGFTPLFFAVREGHMDVVRRLLIAGLDVNEALESKVRIRKGPTSGISPLILAVENGHFDLAVKLLEAGADPNDQRSGYTALHTLTWVRKPKRGDEDDGDPSPAGSGRLTSLEFVERLALFGADLNIRLERGPAGRGRLSKVGATPFLMASETADLPLMKTLVELGADPSIPNIDNCTPLMAAAGIGQDGRGEEAGTQEEALEAVEYLLFLGADVNAVDNHGQTAMHGAAYKSVPRIVHFLDQSGADVAIWNRPNRYGWTPLHLAHGYRPGNFKPSPETMESLEKAMRGAGVEPPSKIIPPAAPDQYQN